jgi:outer membrane lipoprotein-sorting protein
MSQNPAQESPDDRLWHAESALRRSPLPDGPSPRLVQETLAALEAADQADTTLLSRRRIMFTISKIAAVVIAAAGGLFYAAFAPSVAKTEPFAEAAQKLHDAHALSYRVTIEAAAIPKPMTMRVFFQEPNLFRTETEGGVSVVVDHKAGKQLIVDPAAKSAMILETKNPQAAPAAGAGADLGLVERLRQLVGRDAKPAGQKNIGGVMALGYLVNLPGGLEMTVWVDPNSRLPLREESVTSIGGKEYRTVVTDFQIDPALDPAIFRLEPPAGYAVQKGESDLLGMDDKAFMNPEKAAADLLRLFADKTRGTFPKRLDDIEFKEFEEVFAMKKEPGKLPGPETLRIIQAMGRFWMATHALKDGFGYNADGVKLGDADKMIFWYRPEGAAQYRAVYGDLHAGDVTADKIPAKKTPGGGR